MVRPWEPPSFDDGSAIPGNVLGLPTVGQLESIESGVRKSAAEEGRENGYAKGMAEGYAAGFDQGRQEGREAALSEAREELSALSAALHEALGALVDLPTVVGEDLTELAYEIGLRLSGGETLDRSAFVAAVQEALMRLPRPGETLFVRLAPESVAAWQTTLQDPGLPFGCQIQPDPAVAPGHAFVEIDGARINVGALARRALLRMALGLPLDRAA